MWVLLFSLYDIKCNHFFITALGLLFIHNLGIFIYYKSYFQISILSSASSFCGPSFTTYSSGSPWSVAMAAWQLVEVHLVHLALLHHLFLLLNLSTTLST